MNDEKYSEFYCHYRKIGWRLCSFVSGVDIASQGNTVEEAKIKLQEAIELFYEHASKKEIVSRLKTDVFITNMQIAVA